MSQNKIVMKGSNLTLSCGENSKEESRKQIWRFKGQILSAGDTSFVPQDLENIRVLAEGRLFIEHVEIKNEGFYYCSLGKSEPLKEMHISVEGK